VGLWLTAIAHSFFNLRRAGCAYNNKTRQPARRKLRSRGAPSRPSHPQHRRAPRDRRPTTLCARDASLAATTPPPDSATTRQHPHKGTAKRPRPHRSRGRRLHVNPNRLSAQNKPSAKQSATAAPRPKRPMARSHPTPTIKPTLPLPPKHHLPQNTHNNLI
jgi:hypothetical protein